MKRRLVEAIYWVTDELYELGLKLELRWGLRGGDDT